MLHFDFSLRIFYSVFFPYFVLRLGLRLGMLLGLVRVKLYFTKTTNFPRPCWTGYEKKVLLPARESTTLTLIQGEENPQGSTADLLVHYGVYTANTVHVMRTLFKRNEDILLIRFLCQWVQLDFYTRRWKLCTACGDHLVSSALSYTTEFHNTSC